MVMKRILWMVFALFALGSYADAQKQTVYARTSVRCLGVELDGSQTLRVQGYGRNRSDAKEQAMKNAVWAVIFDGIRDYFNIFFMDNGEYKKYVSLRDTRRMSRGRAKDKVGYSYDLTVRVLRAELKARLKADNVID